MPTRQKIIAPMAWPPISENTGNKLKDLYLSRKWSFNCQAEQEFTADFASYHGAEHGIFMANGTVTLECALLAADIGKGDEVIVPALTWIASAMAIRYVGATPVFVDLDPDNLCIDPEKIEASITRKTKAVIAVHLYGSMADIDRIKDITEKHDLFFIEDCAHMHGGVWNGRGVGTWGNVGSFSFQQSKSLSAGEGGICITNDDKLAELIYRAKHIGYDSGAAQGGAKIGPPAGLQCHNYRATGFQALILSDQLRGFPAMIEKYNSNAAIIENKLSNIEGVRVQSRGRLADPQGYYALVIIFDEEPLNDIPVTTIVDACKAEGLNLGLTYGPVYQHMLFNLQEDEYSIPQGGCPVAETVGFERALVMAHPYLGCDEETVVKIGDIIAKVAKSMS